MSLKDQCAKIDRTQESVDRSQRVEFPDFGFARTVQSMPILAANALIGVLEESSLSDEEKAAVASAHAEISEVLGRNPEVARLIARLEQVHGLQTVTSP